MSSDKNKEDKSNDDKSDPESKAGASGVDFIRRYLATKLGLYDDTGEETEKLKVLDDVSLDGIVNYMKSDKCQNIITMAGAGISTSAGIPDFRSPVSGLYHNLQKYNLPHPQAIFELDFFRENPRPFFELAKELYPGTFNPTICHYFIKLLNEKGVLLRHYTQNIDTLERVAEIPGGKLVEAHGTFNQGHCLECRREYSQAWMKEKIFTDGIPVCDDCPGVVKPDIVFFGENLPDDFHKKLLKDFPNCDLLIVLGSSLAVQPFASLIDRVPNTCPRLLINREKAGQRSGIMAMMGIGGGLDFESEDNTRDVAWLGDCDEGCELLANKLGWGDELREMFSKATNKMKEEKESSPAVKDKKEPSPVAKDKKEDSPAAKEEKESSPAAKDKRDSSPAAKNKRDSSPAAKDKIDSSPAVKDKKDSSPAHADDKGTESKPENKL